MKHMIFTDGSSRGNPGPGGYAAVIITDETVREIGGRENMTTNNRMEITAAIEALKTLDVSARENITIYSDSSYVINGITKWVHGWQKKGWVTSTKEEVVNRDLWERLVAVSHGRSISWTYVGGHVGVPGNERCDVIATSLALGENVSLYNGSRADYPISDIFNVSADAALAGQKKKSSSRSKAAPYSYISMVDGKIMSHRTWAECEARVKGKSGARYKKTLSKEEEVATIAEFSRK